MPTKASGDRRKGRVRLAKKASGKRTKGMSRPKKAPRKNRLVMCRDFMWFGSASLAIGAVFFFLTLITTLTLVRFFVGAFFLILGAIDLTLYVFFREK